MASLHKRNGKRARVKHYFLRAITNYGPLNCAIKVNSLNRRIKNTFSAVAAEAQRRGVELLHWDVEPITEEDYLQLS